MNTDDLPEKPPNKRVEQISDKITEEMWASLEVREMPKVRSNKVITFLIRKLAENTAAYEQLIELYSELAVDVEKLK